MAAFGPPWRRVSVILLSLELALKMMLSRNQGWRGEKQITSYFRPSTTRLGQLKTHSGTIKRNSTGSAGGESSKENSTRKQGKRTGKQQAVLKRANPRGSSESSNLFSQCFFSSMRELITFADLRQKPQGTGFSVYSFPQPYW